MLLLWWNLIVAHTHTHVLTKIRLKERVENLNNSVPTHTHVVAKLGKERKRDERNTNVVVKLRKLNNNVAHICTHTQLFKRMALAIVVCPKTLQLALLLLRKHIVNHSREHTTN